MQARLVVQPEQTWPLPPGQQQSQHNHLVSWYLHVQQFAVLQLAHVKVEYFRRRQLALERQSCLRASHCVPAQ